MKQGLLEADDLIVQRIVSLSADQQMLGLIGIIEKGASEECRRRSSTGADLDDFGGARAIGPILGGFSKPWMDLSRGCGVQDIIDVAVVSALLGDTTS